MRFFYSVAILFIILLGTQTQAKNLGDKQSYLYVSLNDLKLISIFKIDNQSGDLTLVKSIPLSGKPGPFIIDPTHKFLHAGISSNRTVSSFRIDENSGDLSSLRSVDISWDPTYISTDKKGRYLFLTFYKESKTSIFSIADNGEVKSGAIQVLTAELNPHSILIDKSNKFLFVPCRTAESIQQYKFDEFSGQLTSNSPEKIATPDSTGPRHFAFHPFLDMVYVSNEFGRSVTGFKFNTNDGTLSKQQTLTMQPENPKPPIIGNQGGADIKISPDGRFLYATTREPDKIAAYTIDQKTGMLTFIANYPTEKMPRSIDIDPSSKFVYVGGQNTGKIAIYKIDPSNGSLTFLKNYTVGNYPAWVVAVELNGSNTVAVNENNKINSEYSLSQNYPNPFNPTTFINYKVQASGNVTLKVFDMLGREVATLVNEEKSAGSYSVQFNVESLQGASLSSGVYFYTLRAGNYSSTKKMILTK